MDVEGAQPARLRRELDLRAAVALGVGGTIGGGIFVLVGAAAGRAGPGTLAAFGLAFVAAILIALPYAELACRYPLAGGGYAFARAALGARWGFLMGWCYWGAYIFVSGYVTLGFGGYLRALTGIPAGAGALVLVLVITALNLRGVRVSGIAQTAVVVLALTALAAFGILGLPHVARSNFTPLLPHGAPGVLSASLLAFLAFGGFDMIAAAGEEVRDPQRTLPLAIFATLLVVLGLYLLASGVAIGLVPAAALAGSPAPLADAAAAAFGPHGRLLVTGAAVLTTAATANAVLVVTSRVAFAMARDGLLPAGLARVAPATGVPWAAVLLNGLLLGAITLTSSVALAAGIGGFLYVLHFVFPLASLLAIRRRDPGRPAFRVPLPALVLPLAFAACAALMAASGTTGWLGGLAWLAAGGLAAGVARLRRTRGVRPAPPGEGAARSHAR